MFEVNAKRTLAALRGPVLAMVVPSLALASCIDEAAKFRSRPDTADAAASRSSVPSAASTTTEAYPSVESGPSRSDTNEARPSAPAESATFGDGGLWGSMTSQAEPTSAAPQTPADGGHPDGSVPLGYVAPELVGVWQQTSLSNPEYAGEFGETFSAVAGFGVQLEIEADGAYSLAHSMSGVAGECAEVSRVDESTGVATLDGNRLTLWPVARTIDVSNCDGHSSDDTNLEPIVLTVRLGEGHEANGGMRTFVMRAEGFGFPLSLTSLFREPNYVPKQPAQPEEFVLGVNGPSAKLQGQWVASASGTDRHFYDPVTGEFQFPEVNDSPQRWLRFDGRGYETAVALQNVNSEGACKLDLIYYERGNAAFAVIEDVEELGSHFIGHASFVASDSRLIVNIRECDEKNRSVRYDLAPLTSYFRWVYLSADRPPESFTLGCDFDASEWQSLLCDDGTVGFVRPE